MATLSENAADDVRQALDAATADNNNIPGLVLAVVDRKGQTVFQHASGTLGLGSKQPMTMDTVFWIASCTKMIVAVAAMQLVEQGKLRLDDANQLAEAVPELAKVKVLEGLDENGKAKLVDQKERITTRMLLSHTGE